MTIVYTVTFGNLYYGYHFEFTSAVAMEKFIEDYLGHLRSTEDKMGDTSVEIKVAVIEEDK